MLVACSLEAGRTSAFTCAVLSCDRAQPWVELRNAAVALHAIELLVLLASFALSPGNVVYSTGGIRNKGQGRGSKDNLRICPESALGAV